MRNYVSALLWITILLPAISYAGVITESHFDSNGEGGWDFSTESVPNCSESENFTASPHFSIIADPAPGTSGKSGSIKFPKGMHDGYWSSSSDYTSGYDIPEFYWTFYWKASPNYYWHNVDNKLVYIKFYEGSPGSYNPNFYLSAKAWATETSGSPRVVMQSNIGTYEVDGYQGYSVNTQRNTWYKFTIHAKMNTLGVSDGIIQVWINDRLYLSNKGLKFRRDDNSKYTGFRIFEFGTIFGGYYQGTKGMCKPADDYMIFDESVLSTDPPSTNNDLLKQPSPPENLKIN